MNVKLLVGTVIVVVILIAMATYALYSHIQGTGTSPASQGQTKLNTTVTLPPWDQRLVSLAPSDTQILISLGLGKHLIGMDSYSFSLLQQLNYTSLVPSNVSIFQQISPPNVSGLLLLNPSLVVGEEGLLGSGAGQIEKAGLNLTLTNNDYASNFTQVEQGILNLSKSLGLQSRGQQVVSWMNSKISQFSREGNVTIAYLIWICPNYQFYTAGGNVFINNIIQLSGGVNVFQNQSGYPLLGPSSLTLADPQVIVVQEMYNVSYTEYMISHIPGIQSTKAYQDHRIYILSENLPTEILNEPGPLSVYGIPLMESIVSGTTPSYVNSSYVMKEYNVSLPVF